jgi:uncharacterized membrane protein
MTQKVSRRVSRRLAVVAGILAALCASLALSFSHPPTASANEYCYGVTLSNWQYCIGAERMVYGVRGHGDQHSVCVGVQWGISGSCSSGPGATAEQYGVGEPPQVFMRKPWIEDNAAGSNKVWGNTF